MQARLVSTRTPVTLAFVFLVVFMTGVTPAAAGALKVTSFPSGAQVLVDGVNTGKVTPMNINLTDGDHVVVVQIPGSSWNPDTRTVTIVPGNNDLSVTLLPMLTVGPPGPKGDQGDQGIQGIPGSTTHSDPPCFDNVNRYVDCGNGTVTDTVTGLVWLKNASCLGSHDWVAANQVAAGLKNGDCGGTLTDDSSPGDWRLPTKDEWSAAIARAVALGCTSAGPGTVPSLTNDAGTGCFSVGLSSLVGVAFFNYWSSSTDEADPVRAKAVHLGNGNLESFFKNGIVAVWPVRGGRR